MNKFKLTVAASLVLGSSLMPMAVQAQTKHRKLKTAAAGVAGYEVAKHSHNRFLRKHRVAIGVASAIAAHHYMKKHPHH